MSTDAIDAYVQQADPRLQEIVQGLRALLRETVPEAREAINPWGLPTWEVDGPLCYVSLAKNHVTFGFAQGTSLDDPHGLLEGTGKNLRHVKLRQVEDLRREGLRELVQAAERRDREAPARRMGRRGRV